jgi:5'-nucleotidase
MKILITNDDGIASPGIATLVASIKQIADVVVVAPDTEQSAVGHAVTISFPLRVEKFNKNGEFFGYAVSGTPADCVKIAVKEIFQNKPDMIISGINQGPNTGTHIIYSGTVSAATEGTILGIPSFAVSLATYTNPDFSFSAELAKKIALMIQKNSLPKGVLLNVNVPAVPRDQIKGTRLTVQGETKFVGALEKRIDPRGKTYYWLTPEITEISGPVEFDTIAIQNNEVSITPLHYDMTAKEKLDIFKKWQLGSLML